MMKIISKKLKTVLLSVSVLGILFGSQQDEKAEEVSGYGLIWYIHRVTSISRCDTEIWFLSIIDTRIAAHGMDIYHAGAAVFVEEAKMADNSVSGT